MRAPKTVGIIGGLGPAATVDLFSKLVRETKAERDQDHLRILIDNNPRVPNRNEAIAGKGPSPGPAFAGAARGLERAGADFIVMACNTAHAFAAEIRAAIAVPFVSMIDASVDAVRALEPRPARVGLMAADGCLRAELYQSAFAEAGIEPILLPEAAQARFMALVYRIKGGDVGADVRAAMAAHARALIAADAQTLVAACTEIPLVLDADALAVPLLSSTDALVARTLAFAWAR